MKFDDQDTHQNVLSGMSLWLAFEYLSPQKPPQPELAKMTCNWAIPIDSQGDADMPWVSKDKQDDLAKLFRVEADKKRFLIYAGILPGREYTNAARQMLGVKAINDEEAAEPGDAASLLLPVSSDGRVAGLPFVSSTPWALGSLSAATASSSRFDFRGFFGKFGAEERTITALKELLIKRTLLPEQNDENNLVTASDLLASAKSPEEASQLRKQYRTITADDVRELTSLVFDRLGWRPPYEEAWIIQTQRLSKKDMDDPLNSFYAEDIETVEQAVVNGRFDAALKQFLSNKEAAVRIDLDANGNKSPLIEGVHPSRLPLAAWPGTYPLVTAQQFAVNTIERDLANEGIYSVNGPPGTGKTTMLKDIIASVIQQRADRLLVFSDPCDALSKPLKIDDHRFPAWELDSSLCGFGIVVTSANNGAVENISRELPSLSAIDKNIKFDYFSKVADSVALEKGKSRPQQAEAWGVISAALGNSTNRNLFAQNFWWGDKDSKTLPNKSPNPMAKLSIQDWIEEYGASVPSWHVATERYRLARERAQNAIATAAVLADQLQRYPQLQKEQVQSDLAGKSLYKICDDGRRELHEASTRLSTLQVKKAKQFEYRRLLKLQQEAQDDLDSAKQKLSALRLSPNAQLSKASVTNQVENTKRQQDAAQQNFNNHLQTEPGLLSRIFFRRKAAIWDKKNDDYLAAIQQAQSNHDQSCLGQQAYEQWLRDVEESEENLAIAEVGLSSNKDGLVAVGLDPNGSLEQVEKSYQELGHDVMVLKEEVNAITTTLESDQQALLANHRHQEALSLELRNLHHALSQAKLTDNSRKAWHLKALSREDFHQASPYQDDGELFNARRDLFIAAMELHQAFVVAAWPKLKGTLAAFTLQLQGLLPPHRIAGGPMRLWDAFFLLVPLISTSFASFPRLFRGVGNGELAWTLIDEAGQATPQQALGAIWRSRRVVIVGDPIQLEPVVGIPQELVGPLKEYCQTPDIYVPPDASVQTMADRSNRYGTLMGANEPDTAIWLGSPLVVHRRCLRPMFDIANAIAYENKMVYGTADDHNFPAPDSSWLDVSNDDAQGHWIESQARIVMELIHDLTAGQIKKDGKLRLYVITPFKVVSNNMREMLATVFGSEDAKKMCGTVHTFQGKEADYVIFLLGGDPSRPGVISGFAGRKPNLVNVAVTRAKKRLYVVGNHSFWCGSSDTKEYYGKMSQLLGASVESSRDLIS